MMSMFFELIASPEKPSIHARSGGMMQYDLPRISMDDDAPVIDAATFNEMMDVIGPCGRDEFLACLASDLRSVAASLDGAIEARDAQEVQKKAHILMGLAGTVGATRLHAMATALHRDAVKATGQSFWFSGTQMLCELDRLIRFCLGVTEVERLA